MNTPNKKLPKGSKLSLVQTQGLTPGSYNLYNLQGLSAGKVQFLLDLLTDAKASASPGRAALAEDIICIIPSIKLF